MRNRGARARAIVTASLTSTFVLALLTPACRAPEAVPDADRGTTIEVVVTVPPLADLVRRIGGSEVEVSVLLPEGALPELYQPTPRQLQRLARARLVVQVGLAHLTLESRHVTPLLAADSELRVVNIAEAVTLDGGTPSPGAALDPHLWLSPTTMRTAAAAVAAQLSSLAPLHRLSFAERLAELEGEIDRLDSELASRLADGGGRCFLVQHPAWGHFAESYGLLQVAIEHDGKEPGARALVKLTERARREGCTVVLAQRGLPHAAAHALAREIGAGVVVLDPLAEDWMASLRSAAAALSQSWHEGTRTS